MQVSFSKIQRVRKCVLEQLAFGGRVGVINSITFFYILFWMTVLSKNLMFGYLLDISGFLMDFQGISDLTDNKISGFMLGTKHCKEVQ